MFVCFFGFLDFEADQANMGNLLILHYTIATVSNKEVQVM